MDWAEGYPAATDYTTGYFRQLNPVFARFVLTVAGLEARPIRTACELGYGQGVSVAMHQAASGASWWGTDFMPGQAAFAQALAGPEAKLAEQGFAEFCLRDDLPDFDFVCAHGIWSWISAENRAVIVDFLRRKLKPGGVFFVSYNTDVGWAGLRPYRALMVQHVETMSPPTLDPVAAIRAALPFMKDVFDADSVYAAQNPRVPSRLEQLTRSLNVYDTHEYLGHHWNPMSVGDVADELAGAKLSYGCGARLLDQVPGLAMLPEQQAALNTIPDPMMREVARDMVCGTPFRRDYWIKGPRRLDLYARAMALDALRVVLVEPVAMVDHVRAETHVGGIDLPLERFKPVLAALADHRPHDLASLAVELAGQGMGPEDTLSAVLVLVEVGAVQPAHGDDAAITAAVEGSQALNERILAGSYGHGAVGHLANPATGGATEVPRLQQLLVRGEAEADPAGWAAGMAGVERIAAEAAAARLSGGRRAVLTAQGVL